MIINIFNAVLKNDYKSVFEQSFGKAQIGKNEVFLETFNNT